MIWVFSFLSPSPFLSSLLSPPPPIYSYTTIKSDSSYYTSTTHTKPSVIAMVTELYLEVHKTTCLPFQPQFLTGPATVSTHTSLTGCYCHTMPKHSTFYFLSVFLGTLYLESLTKVTATQVPNQLSSMPGPRPRAAYCTSGSCGSSPTSRSLLSHNSPLLSCHVLELQF